MTEALRLHGGADARGAARHDFSTCANAAGPCPAVVERLRAVDLARYPDPSGTALRERLAHRHGVAPARILLAASASEFIQRITAVGALLQPGPVEVPRHGYGDYRQAAGAWRRDALALPATLRWCAEPSSPLGHDAPPPPDPAALPTVLDAVYEPLRLAGAPTWSAADRDAVFVLHSPNKALGLCGVRGAYAVAPRTAAWDVDGWCAALARAAPSWPLSAHGVALLAAWCEPAVERWLDATRPVLAGWKHDLVELLERRGFACRTSRTPFFCVRPPPDLEPEALRSRDVAVRDAASFGLPGEWRVSAQPPEAQAALGAALDSIGSMR